MEKKKSVEASEDGHRAMNKKRKLKDLKGNIDLNAIESVEDLEKIGMDQLKAELQVYGMKCGGNLKERAQRLFLLKSCSLSDLPRSCFASRKKGKKSKKKT